MKPEYVDLSNDALLECCIGEFTHNNNESYNQFVWIKAPETPHADAKAGEIAPNVSTSILNEGNFTVLLFLNRLE